MLYIELDALVREFDANMYLDDLGRAMKAEFIYAAKAFYLAAVPKVHVDTGMSLASFQGLAKLVKEQLDMSARWIYTPTKKYNPPGGPSLPKTPASGIQLSSKAADIVKLTGTRAAPNVAFHLETSVWHYKVWDTLGFRGQPPWLSYQAGTLAMMAALKTLSDGVPPIARYMITSRIRTNSVGGIITTKTDERRQWTSPKTL